MSFFPLTREGNSSNHIPNEGTWVAALAFVHHSIQISHGFVLLSNYEISLDLRLTVLLLYQSGPTGTDIVHVINKNINGEMPRVSQVVPYTAVNDGTRCRTQMRGAIWS